MAPGFRRVRARRSSSPSGAVRVRSAAGRVWALPSWTGSSAPMAARWRRPTPPAAARCSACPTFPPDSVSTSDCRQTALPEEGRAGRDEGRPAPLAQMEERAMDIYGTQGNDTLTGTSGRDDIVGRGGDDTLFGGAGNDDLYGGNGDDTLVGGAGNDEMKGGNGADLYIYEAGHDEIYWRSGDTIEISASLGVSSFAEILSLASPRDGGDDTLISFGGGDSILLEDV